MRRVRVTALFGVLLLGCIGCSAQAGPLTSVAAASSSPEPTRTSESDSTASTPIAATSSTTNSPAASGADGSVTGMGDQGTTNFGPVKKSVPLEITTKDGYKATLTVTWHKAMVGSFATLLPGCAAVIDPSTSARPDKYVVSVVAATLTAEFHTTGGFTRPPRGLTLRAEGSATSICEAHQDTTTPFYGVFQLTPALSSTTVTWVIVVEKTPNNPDGLSVDATSNFSVTVTPSIDFNGSCQEGTKAATDYCSTSFGA